MPKLSLYRPNRTNDYKFFDRIIREQYVVGGLDLYIHAFIGIKTDDGDIPISPPPDEFVAPPIEDLLFLENRNRNYDADIHIMRGVYNVMDLDFDLSQFGLFVSSTDTLYITFHYNDMIDSLGRKLISGDVIEVPNLKDYDPLNKNIPTGLPKYYVVQEGSFAAEGFSQTWLPHLWRVKCSPMKGSQEYKDILDKCMDSSGGIDGDNGECNETCTTGQWMCQHDMSMYINDGVIIEANEEVPLSGYDNNSFFIIGDDQDMTANVIRGDNTFITVDGDLLSTDNGLPLIKSNAYAVGYLTGDGMPPNGQQLSTGVIFPPDAKGGDYILRMDYMPHRLFQFDGTQWNTIEDSVRTDMYLGHTVQTQRSEFANNTDTVHTTDRGDVPSRQALSKLLRPEDDN